MKREWASAALTIFVVVAAVLGLSARGALQPLELVAYDAFLGRLEPNAAGAGRIALMEISERDIQTFGRWPLTDADLTVLLESLLAAGASAVGVDLYRDLPLPPGRDRLESLLEGDTRLFFVFKHGTPGAGGIPGPAILEGTPRLGFGDLLLDPDGRVRRGLLFLDGEDGAAESSLPLLLALHALASSGIGPLPDPDRPEWLRLGPTTLPYLEAHDGGYGAIDDRGYQILHDYHGRAHGFQPIAFLDVMEGRLAADALEGRLVLVGASAESLNDFALVPAGIGEGEADERGLTGIRIHAMLLDQLLRVGFGESRPLRFQTRGQEAASVVLSGLLGSLLAWLAQRLRRGSTLALTLGLALALGALAIVGQTAMAAGMWMPVAAPAFAFVGGAGGLTAWSSARDRAQRSQLMRIFAQVQSPRVADELWRRREEYLVDGRLEPAAGEVTVLFLDMKGYTASAEKMGPAELMSWINDFMAPMARLIEEHGGYPDDYFGDGIKADFGVPVLARSEAQVAETARQAVSCASAMADELGRINAGYRAAGLPTVALRVGVHTGPVVVGLLGSRNKGKYTVVGDAVVTAQRLESTDRVEHDFEQEPCRILLSDRTHALVAGATGEERFASIGSVALKGKAAPIAVYRLCSGRGDRAGESAASRPSEGSG